MFLKLTDKMEQIENYKNTLGQIRTVMRFATPREERGRWNVRVEDPVYSEELQNLLDAETVEEEERVHDETLSEGEGGDLSSSSLTGITEAEITDADMEVPAMRNRVLRHDGAHEAANGEPALPGRDGGEEPAEEEESFELEETPMQRYQRYCQSGMEEVSDPEEWADIHYGFRHESDSEPGGASRRSRSRDDYDDGSNPQPKSMPRPLSQQVGRQAAMDRAMKIVDDRDASGAQPSSSVQAPSVGIMNKGNYYLSSIPMANLFNISPVPKAVEALEDYRWDLLMQGIGPENVVVHNCRNLSNAIPLQRDRAEREKNLRLLRNMQNLLVKFQSGSPEKWIEAAKRVISWINDDAGMANLGEAETEYGSPRRYAEEGEEEEETDDSDHSQPGDRDDPEGPEDDRGDYDHDDDDAHRGGGYGGIGGSGNHHDRVAGRPSSGAMTRRSAG